jgi:hypothetical protein
MSSTAVATNARDACDLFQMLNGSRAGGRTARCAASARLLATSSASFVHLVRIQPPRIELRRRHPEFVLEPVELELDDWRRD